MKDRLSQFMKQEGLTAGRIAEIAGVQPSAVSHMLSGRNNPGYDFIYKILESFPNLNARWFILGVPPMYISQSANTNSVSALFDVRESANKETPANLTAVSENTAEINSHAAPLKPTKREIEKIVFFYNDNTFEVYK